MIKHSLKEDLVHISIDNIDFSYRIPVKTIGNTTDWRVGEKEKSFIIIENVSKWALNLFTKETTEVKYVNQFKTIVMEHYVDNAINWEKTQLAINIQNEYNRLITTNIAAGKKMKEDEIISLLKKEYKLN